MMISVNEFVSGARRAPGRPQPTEPPDSRDDAASDVIGSSKQTAVNPRTEDDVTNKTDPNGECRNEGLCGWTAEEMTQLQNEDDDIKVIREWLEKKISPVRGLTVDF